MTTFSPTILAARKKMIAAHPFFILLNDEGITELAALFQERIFMPNEAITKEGDIVNSIYFIVSGEAEITNEVVSLEKSYILTLMRLHSGEAIGLAETSLYSIDGFRTATVTAIDEVEVMEIDLKQFYKFIVKTKLYPEVEATLDYMDRCAFLRGIEQFVSLNNYEVNFFARQLARENVEAGNFILQQNDPGNKCYFILSGGVETITANNTGFLPSGSIFGEVALLNKAPYQFSARAKENCELLTLSANTLLDLKRQFPKIDYSFYAIISNRCRPRINKNVYVHLQFPSSKEKAAVLENRLNNRFLVLSKLERRVWRLIDGRKNLDQIISKFERINKDGVDSRSFVINLISRLANFNFIASTKIDFSQKITWYNWLRKIFIRTRLKP